MKNVAEIKNCYGCGVCSVSCPKHIINIRLNTDGFYESYIDEPDKCIDCGFCLDVCAFIQEKKCLESSELNAWAAWSNDKEIQFRCSSGGIGFEIGRQLLSRGYKVVGCRYNVEKQQAEHFVSTSQDDLLQTIGSKYIQSYTEEAFKEIDRKSKYLVVGTPCQIDSFRRYIRKYKCEENFILMDFFCHAVPSKLMWDSYLKTNGYPPHLLRKVSWRNKETGWHDSWAMKLEGDETQTFKLKSKGDIFYKLFLGDYCSNPACQKKCKYKYDSSSADIRIGDLWGNTYANNDKGVSALISFTHKGLKVVETLSEVTLIEHSFDIVAEGQLRHNCKKSPLSFVARMMLHSKTTYTEEDWNRLFLLAKVFKRVCKLFGK